jgi:hypothetical protein
MKATLKQNSIGGLPKQEKTQIALRNSKTNRAFKNRFFEKMDHLGKI